MASGNFSAGTITATGVQGGNGSETNPTFTFSDDTNTGIYSSINDRVSITTAGKFRANFGLDGNALALVGETYAYLSFYPYWHGGTGVTADTGQKAYLGYPSSGSTQFDIWNAVGDIVFGPANSEAVRFKSDGKVGIGTDNPVEKLHVNGNARVGGVLLLEAATQVSSTANSW
jgi:hypothetical protein